MSNNAPQRNDFAIAYRVFKMNKHLFIIGTIFSMVMIGFSIQNSITIAISVFLIVILSGIELYGNIEQSRAETLRRLDFLDNSFGTKYLHNSSQEYFDNDELSSGRVKAMTNLFQNSFNSFIVSKKMLQKKTIELIIWLVIIFGLATYGFINSMIAIPILQCCLSRYAIVEYFKLNQFNKKAKICFDDLKELFVKISQEQNSDLFEVSFIKILLNYEVGIAENKVILDDYTFNRMNAQLTQEWQEIKFKYAIK